MKSLKSYIGLLTVLIAIAGVAMAANSTSGYFSVTADSSTVNWLNTSGLNGYAVNVTVANLTAPGLNVYVLNATSNVKNSTFGSAPFVITPSNSTTLSDTSTMLSIYFKTAALMPGRYSGPIYFTNNTRTNENASISFTLDVPIAFTSRTGRFSGNVSGSTEIYHFNVSSYENTAGIRINLTGLTVPVSIIVKDGSGTTKATQNTPGNLTYLFGTNSTNWRPPNEYWSIEISNSSGSTTYAGTLDLLAGNFIVNSSANTSTVNFVENIGRAFVQKNATVTISNFDSSALTITDVSSSGFLNRTDSPATNWANFTTNLSTGSVSANSNLTFRISVNVDTNATRNTSGTYQGTVGITTSNGYPSTIHNITITLNYTNALLVGVTSVVNQSGGGQLVLPGSMMNATMTVRYQDGTDAALVPGTDSLTAAAILHTSREDRTASWNYTPTLTYWNFTVAGGNYFVNYTLPASMPGGNYSMYFTATKGGSTGTGIYNHSWVNTSGMTVTMRSSGSDSISDYTGTQYYIDVNVSNIGWANATSVVLQLTPGNSISIVSGGLAGTSATYTVGPMAPGNSTTILSLWKVQLSNVGTDYTSVSGTSPTGVWAVTDGMYIATSNSTTSGSSGNQQSGSGSSNNTGTPATDLSITSWPKHMAIAQNGTRSVDITVKNSGSKPIQDISTSVDGLTAGWSKGTQLTNLPAGQEYTLPITFTIPGDATVKNYTITYVASSANATARASADFAVLPSESGKKAINASLVNVTNRYNDLLKKMQDAASAGQNMSEVNSTLASAKGYLDKANTAAGIGDWFNVNAYIVQAESALNSAESKMSPLSGLGLPDLSGLVSNPFLMVGGGMAALIVAVILVVFKTGKMPSTKGTGGLGKRFKAKMSGLKEAFKRRRKAMGQYHYQPR